MDALPLSTREPEEERRVSVYDKYPLVLSERANWAKKLNKENKEYTKQALANQLFEALELVGGVPRLAAEMDDDPLPWVRTLVSLLPNETKHEHSGQVRVIHSPIPPSPLDGDYEDARIIDSVSDAAALPALPHPDDAIRGDGGPSTGGEDGSMR